MEESLKKDVRIVVFRLRLVGDRAGYRYSKRSLPAEGGFSSMMRWRIGRGRSRSSRFGRM
jgi:hypothetical protein